MASADLRDEVTCSICLDVYIDPVTLRCGHNFCRVCIDRVLDAQEGSGEYSCPECRAHCQERPELLRNIALRNIAERFLSHPEHEVDGVFCTYCDFPVPAVKSCLQCETSMCDNHLRKHDRSVTHTLILPTTSLGNRKCSIHKKILEYYCTEDSACICATCRLDGDHRGHQVETLDEASEKKKEKLRNVLEKLTSKREETERRVQSLQEHRSDVKDKAADVIVWVVALFKDIRRQLDKLEKSVLSDISGQEERVSLSVSGLIRQLEIKKDELSRKMSHIEELCNMTDPLTVLQESGRGDTQEGDNRERDDIKVHDVGDLDECLISNTLNTGLSNIITGLNAFFHIQEPADVLMDVKTAGNYVDISGDLKTATRSEKRQKHPKTAERFQCNQVLSTQSFSSGRHYWEVEGSDSGWWMIGVCYPSIYKAGDQSWIGNNKKSWCLYRSNNQYSVAHNGQVIQLAHKSFCNRLRIYLDYEAGRLSFYELRDPSSLLFTFTATFTEPLHAAFSICQDICGGNGRVTIVSSNK